MVGVGGSDEGCCLSVVVLELALLLADFFLCHPEGLCLYCAFLMALHCLRFRLVNTVQQKQYRLTIFS